MDERGRRAVRALAFVDLCGFTAYADGYGDDRAFDVMEAMRVAVRRSTWGREVQVTKWLGDGAMLVAQDASALVESVLAAHDAVTRTGPLALRAGIAMGSVIMVDADDFMGRPVNLAARLAGCATQYQVLATAEVARAVTGVATARRVGPVEIPGLQGPVDVRELHLADRPHGSGRRSGAGAVARRRSVRGPR